jgi:RHS repeat-associated protein
LLIQFVATIPDRREARDLRLRRARVNSDHLGSVRLVVNASDGTIMQRMRYDEYGQVLEDTNPGFQPFGYAGGLYDPDTGLVRFGARDYDPEIGRWLAKDPSEFGGKQLNFFVFVDNNPVNLLDLNGKCSCGLPDSVNFILNYPNYEDYSGPEVWEEIGGSLEKRYGGENSCAARVSRTLNYVDLGDYEIPPGTPGGNRNWDGDDKRYVISAEKMNEYLKDRFGPPSETLRSQGDLELLKIKLGHSGTAIVSSKGHVAVVTQDKEDPYVSSYLGEVWVLPGSNGCECR